MLSETMRKKLTRHFHFRDLNKDGFVEQTDWEQCARNLAHIQAWQPESSAYGDILDKHIQIWVNFWQPADQDNDGKVSLDEYLQLADSQRGKGFALNLVSQLFGAIFDIIDLDNDGIITLYEYKLYFKAWGIAEQLAAPAFARLDLNGDGRLSRTSFLQFGANFYINDEPDVPGNWLFGPYE